MMIIDIIFWYNRYFAIIFDKMKIRIIIKDY